MSETVRTRTLEDTIAKIAELIFLCEQALAINDIAVEFAEPINIRKLNHFFAPVQYAFFQTFTLDICKIFEQPSGYDLHSIPAAVPLINVSNLKQQEAFKKACIALSDNSLPVASMIDNNLVEYYKSETIRRLNLPDIKERLNSFKNVRDKWIAHSEAVGMIPSLNREHADYLLGFAKRFVSTVGWCFYSIVYEDDGGNFALDSDAGTASRAAMRILEHMGINARKTMHDDVRASSLVTTIRQAEWPEAVKEKVRQSI